MAITKPFELHLLKHRVSLKMHPGEHTRSMKLGSPTYECKLCDRTVFSPTLLVYQK